MSETGPDIPHAPRKSEAEEKKPGLARDARILADLDRAWSDQLLARVDAGAALARDLEASSLLSLPLPSEINQTLSRVEARIAFSAQEIDQLLSIDRIGEIAVEGMRLNELLDRGASGIEQRAMLKRGLLFLQRKMYTEAAEWWTLHRPAADLESDRAHLLLTLLLALTHRLSGNEVAARSALQDARQSRAFPGRAASRAG
ncbi:MAG TPA: hypothetical protein VN851_18475 [Thermoanaerobaculia bacterium]|nr:hypothetical protein [Thermoanaerobaculia bacterium]